MFNENYTFSGDIQGHTRGPGRPVLGRPSWRAWDTGLAQEAAQAVNAAL